MNFAILVISANFVNFVISVNLVIFVNFVIFANMIFSEFCDF